MRTIHKLTIYVMHETTGMLLILLSYQVFSFIETSLLRVLILLRTNPPTPSSCQVLTIIQSVIRVCWNYLDERSHKHCISLKFLTNFDNWLNVLSNYFPKFKYWQSNKGYVDVLIQDKKNQWKHLRQLKKIYISIFIYNDT